MVILDEVQMPMIPTVDLYGIYTRWDKGGNLRRNHRIIPADNIYYVIFRCLSTIWDWDVGRSGACVRCVMRLGRWDEDGTV